MNSQFFIFPKLPNIYPPQFQNNLYWLIKKLLVVKVKPWGMRPKKLQVEKKSNCT